MYNLNGLFVGRPSYLRRQQTKRDSSVTSIFPDHSYVRGVSDEYNYGHIISSGQATLISYSHDTPYTKALSNRCLVAVGWLRRAVKLSEVALTEIKTIGHSAHGVQTILHCMGWRPNAPECKKTAPTDKWAALFAKLFSFNCILLSFGCYQHLKLCQRSPFIGEGGGVSFCLLCLISPKGEYHRLIPVSNLPVSCHFSCRQTA